MKLVFPIRVFSTIVFCWLNMALISNALAEENPLNNNGDDEEMSEMLELMDILEEETSIATKTKVNSDFVPGMVTVLHGEDMHALGKLNVWEALTLVPGLKTLKSSTGTPLVIARGVPFPFNSGNIKIMLNSTTMSSEISGINSSLLLIPIEQVERIEFIRGPSSSIYGSSAYMGLVNIITRKDNKEFNINSLDGKVTSGTGQYYWNDTESSLQVSANLAVQNDNDASSPVNTDAEDEQTSLIVAVDYEQTSLTAQWFERKYAIDGLRATTDMTEEQAVSVVLKQKIQFSDDLGSDIQFSYRDNQFDANKVYQGALARAQMDFNWDVIDKHQLLLGIAFEHYELDEATLCRNNNNPSPGQPGFILGVTPPPGPNDCPQRLNIDGLLRNEQWNNYSLSLQDQYALSENLSLIGGVGFNRNTNTNESNITPRLAIVWKMAENHLLKGQYSKGFRSPTYFELYNILGVQNDLESEQVESYELGYIYKSNELLGRMTLFHSNLENLIFPRTMAMPNRINVTIYENSAHGETQGIELEWEQKLNDYFKWSFNATYTDSEDNRSSESKVSAGVSEWLGNVSFYLQPRENLLITTHYYYVGEQEIPNGNIDGYNKLDLTLNFFQFMHKKVTFRAGVKNALDDSILYYDTSPATTEAVEYSGRTWWAQFSYQL
jgi:outer membrane receptor for ferrienterochelin and colicins